MKQKLFILGILVSMLFAFDYGVASSEELQPGGPHFAVDQGDAEAQNNPKLASTGEGDNGGASPWYRPWQVISGILTILLTTLSALIAIFEWVMRSMNRRTANQGDAAGQFALGFMFAQGRGVRQDDGETVRWYRRSADPGYADVQNDLEVGYAKGRGVRDDDVEAVRWYRLAADQGHADAQYNLGFMYAEGRGVRQDNGEALRWYCLAADQGHELARESVGYLLRR